MGKSSAPPPPDYAAAAKQQGVDNKDAAMYNAAINRPDEIGPDGSRTWAYRDGYDPQNLKAGDVTVTTKLSAEQQHLKDIDNQNKLALGGLSNQMLGTVTDALGKKFDMGGVPNATPLPGTRESMAGPNLKATEIDPGRAVGTQFTQTGPQLGTGPALAANPSSMGAARTFNAGAYSSDREKIAQTLYDSMTRRNEGQFSRQEASLRDRLVNQGLDENSAAFKNQVSDFTNSKNDAYAEAARQAELAGGAEQTRQDTSQGQAFQQQLGASNANFEQKMNAVMSNFGRDQQSNSQNFGQRLAANGQNFTQDNAAAASNFQRMAMAAQQNFGQQDAAISSNYSRGLATNAQNFSQDMQQHAASVGDRQQSLQEQAYLRSLPLNEINAVRSGSQVSGPQFQQYATGFAAAPANSYGAVKDGYQAQLDKSNADNAGWNNLLGVAGKVGAAYVGI